IIHSDLQERAIGDALSTPKLDGRLKPNLESNGFLAAPLSGPIRPLSPDTLSVLSNEEYEQIFTTRNAEHSQQKGTGWRARIRESWIRNKVEGNKGKGMHPFQILFARMGITFVLATAWMWYKKTEHFPLGAKGVRWLLVARGFGGFFGVFGMYYSLLYLPLADATVITFLTPGITCWVCSKLIKEPFTRVEMIGTFVSIFGVVFIARPTSLFQAFGGSDAPSAIEGSGEAGQSDAGNYENVTPIQRLTAVGIALIGVCGSVIAFTTIRWIGKRAHPLISVNYFAAWCTLVSCIMMAFLPGVGFLFPADLKEWGYLIFLGVCGFVMQFLLAAGLSYEKSSRATNMTYTQMLFALTFDKLVFGHTPGVLSIIGSSLILGSAIVVAMQRDSGEKKERPEGRQALGDEEAQQGLLASASDPTVGEDHDRLPVQEVQLRTLR
ncbi:putative membrane protein, partial [Pseudocercospora fuligena]